MRECAHGAVPCRVCVRCRAAVRCVSKNHKSGCHDSVSRFFGGLGLKRGNRLTRWLAHCSHSDRCPTVASHSRLPPPFLHHLSAKLIVRGSDRPQYCPYTQCTSRLRRLKTRPKGPRESVCARHACTQRSTNRACQREGRMEESANGHVRLKGRTIP